MTARCRANWVLGFALLTGAMLPTMASRAAGPADADAAAQPPGKAAVDLFDAMKSGQVEGEIHSTRLARRPDSGDQQDRPTAHRQTARCVCGHPCARPSRGRAGGNNNRRNNNTGGNQNQGVGGGGGYGGGGGGQMGGGAFDVAPEKVAKIKVETVCLEHGKKEPNARVPYELVPIERFTSDARVQELCKLLGTGQLDQRAAQAAAWHLANQMSWEDLLNKKIHHLIGGDEAYFTETEILDAMKITDQALKLADGRSTNSAAAPASTTAASNGRN